MTIDRIPGQDAMDFSESGLFLPLKLEIPNIE